MRGNWRIARILGIDIMIDASWLVIAFLTVYSLGFLDFPHQLNPRVLRPIPDALSISLGVLGTLLLFGSVLAHELAHSVMALQRGIAVNRITLFIFGGVAQIADEPDRPATEFLIAIMGPLLSIALALVFGAAWVWLTLLEPTQFFGAAVTPLIIITSLLARVNAALALFNLAPGFPLDGGRVLRALLWRFWHDMLRATRWATRAGQGIAVILFGVGVSSFWQDGSGGGIWYILLAFFLWNAARDGYRQTLFREALKNVMASQIMTRDVRIVPAEATVQQFVDAFLLPNREQMFVVSQDDAHVGVVGVENVRQVPRAYWSSARLKAAMTPLGKAQRVSPEESAAKVLACFARAEMNEVVVVQTNQVMGFIGRDEFWRYIQLKNREPRA